jgi:hypothetical protein
MLRIDDLLILLIWSLRLTAEWSYSPSSGRIKPGNENPNICVGFMGLSGEGSHVGCYCNQPRLRKYHMGTMALASINTRA